MKPKKFRIYFKLVIYLFKIAEEYKIKLKLPIMALALLKSIEPFTMIIFPGIIIDKLFARARISEVLAVIILMVTISVTISMLEKIYLKKINLMQYRLKNILHERISVSIMKMKYEKIENESRRR